MLFTEQYLAVHYLTDQYRPPLTKVAFVCALSLSWLLPLALLCTAQDTGTNKESDTLFVESGSIRLGIDRKMGASITWLSWPGHKSNAINIADPGRLIQQSYYAGRSLDRTSEGQSKAWSPWTWNPIQGGGVGSWARVQSMEQIDPQSLFAETVPKLWDMPNEEATALMRQWTKIESELPNTVVVRCEFLSQRKEGDRWGPAVSRHQEVPACYFIRSLSQAKSYLGKGEWRDESHPPGPPWGKASPPLKAMACFNAQGQGVAIYSPTSTESWNFGPHGKGSSSDPSAGPCMHVAPLDKISLDTRSTYRYRYWLTVGDAETIAATLDKLISKYADEKAELLDPK